MYCETAYEPTMLAWDYNFIPVNGTLNDPAEVTDTIHCYKFVNHEFNTRILIAYDPTENEP
jgi:hypothetical protein